MAENENEDTYLDRPNRRKASSKATKAIVALLLIVSAVIVIIISIGGWTRWRAPSRSRSPTSSSTS